MGAPSGPYALVPEALTRKMARAGAGPTEWGALCLLLRHRDANTGEMWRLAAEIAETLGVSPGATRQALRRLVARGVLVRVSKGHNGRCAVYRLAPGLWPEGPADGGGGSADGGTARCEAPEARGGEGPADEAARAAWRRAHEFGEYGEAFGAVLEGRA